MTTTHRFVPSVGALLMVAAANVQAAPPPPPGSPIALSQAQMTSLEAIVSPICREQIERISAESYPDGAVKAVVTCTPFSVEQGLTRWRRTVCHQQLTSEWRCGQAGERLRVVLSEREYALNVDASVDNLVVRELEV